MSGRSTRRRSKTVRALEAEEQAEAERQSTPSSTPRSAAAKKRTPGGTKKKSTPIVKPKYLAAESNGPSSSSASSSQDGPQTGGGGGGGGRSRRSLTPSSRSSSRAPSPASSAATAPTRASNRRRSSTQRYTASATANSSASASKRNSGANTPVSRASRSSSVASNAGGRPPIPKLKIKAKLGRGYNPGLVNYKESEYHYGSDFEDEEEEDVAEVAESERSSEESDDDLDDAESDDLNPESDVDLEDIGTGGATSPDDLDSQTPVPFWLREDEEFPPLALPESSEDLLVPNEHLLRVFSVYEVLRRYHHILRLTPFRVEDFCAAVASEEQSNLLSEVHMALLRTLVRAEEANSMSFGAPDQKDSITCVIFFMDSVTWPEALRQFLQSDSSYAKALRVVNSCEYPLAGPDVMIKNRVDILSFLSDQILSTPVVRDYITEDGKLPTEEHCRVCYRPGEVLVCDTCPGVYHLGCLDPPLHEVPEHEWRCYVCHSNDVPGVQDCQGVGGAGSACRQDRLGVDRAGNRYWFLCRRLVVEKAAEEGGVIYYSTVKQLEELSEVLDDEKYEKDLWESMEQYRVEMERQMDVTEGITNSKKAISKKSYFEVVDAAIHKIQRERDEKEAKAREVEEARREREGEPKEEPKEVSPEQSRRKEREERMKKREESRGDCFPEVEGGTKKEVKEEDQSSQKPAPTAIPVSYSVLVKEEMNKTDLRMTRRTVQELTTGTLLFKLGQEGTYKSYINHYTSSSHVLSKQQANEERQKKTTMSHKFSLTDLSSFKWQGSIHGGRAMLIGTLRQTLIQLEASLPSMFMHTNWGLLRKPWLGAVSTSASPRDFARALTVLQCCMKPSMMLQVWNESLGHTQFRKIHILGREERKKQEKRERKEREDEEERLRPFMAHVKYTLGLKHQVHKQKGEEYRAHGQHGWLWLSGTRSFSPCDSNKQGLRAGPYRLAVKYSDVRDGSHKIVLMEPKAFKYLVGKQDELDEKKRKEEEEGEKDNDKKDEEGESPMEVDGEELKEEKSGEESEVKKEEGDNKEKKDKEEDSDNSSKDKDNKESTSDPEVKLNMERARLEEALKNARLTRQVEPEELSADVVDISAGLSNPTRVMFPKVAKKARVLDEFLQRRVQLRSLEERRIEIKHGKREQQQQQQAKAEPESVPPALSSSSVDQVKKESSVEEPEEVDVEGDSDEKAEREKEKSEEQKKKEAEIHNFVLLAKRELWAAVTSLKNAKIPEKIEASPLPKPPMARAEENPVTNGAAKTSKTTESDKPKESTNVVKTPVSAREKKPDEKESETAKEAISLVSNKEEDVPTPSPSNEDVAITLGTTAVIQSKTVTTINSQKAESASVTSVRGAEKESETTSEVAEQTSNCNEDAPKSNAEIVPSPSPCSSAASQDPAPTAGGDGGNCGGKEQEASSSADQKEIKTEGGVAVDNGGGDQAEAKSDKAEQVEEVKAEVAKVNEEKEAEEVTEEKKVDEEGKDTDTDTAGAKPNEAEEVKEEIVEEEKAADTAKENEKVEEGKEEEVVEVKDEVPKEDTTENKTAQAQKVEEKAKGEEVVEVKDEISEDITQNKTVDKVKEAEEKVEEEAKDAEVVKEKDEVVSEENKVSKENNKGIQATAAPPLENGTSFSNEEDIDVKEELMEVDQTPSFTQAADTSTPGAKVELPPIFAEAEGLHFKVTADARNLGLEVPKLEDKLCFESREKAVSSLQDLVKCLMAKKEEFENCPPKEEEEEDPLGGIAVTTTTSSSHTTTTTEKVTTVNGAIQAVAVTSSTSVTQSKTVATANSQTTESVTTTSVGGVGAVASPSGGGVAAAAAAGKATTVKKETKEKDEDGVVRVYSNSDTTGKLYLKRIQPLAESKKQTKIVKYPLAPHFYARTRQKRNILLLSRHDLKRLARKYGTLAAEGYNYNCKNNQQVWPYPCPRPLFKTTWLYRTACMESLQSAALQLRILWACVRWDDMATRPLSTDGKHYQTNDNTSSTTEIIKHRHRGRFLERTQYFKKTVTIPLDVPTRTSTSESMAPIRSGLRKRKRAESPQSSEPKVVEEWVEEEKLELWEIRAYKERLERDRNASITRSRTGIPAKEPQRYDPGALEPRRVGGETIRVRVDGSTVDSPSGKSVLAGTPRGPVTTTSQPMIVRKVTHPDGSISLVHTTAPSAVGGARPIAPNTPTIMPGTRPSAAGGAIPPGTKKVFISKDGKIIGSQMVQITPPQPPKQQQPQVQPAPQKIAIPANPSASPQVVGSPVPSAPPAAAMGSPQQKVQIVRSSDGKIQVRGLLPGQQLVQMPDGKLQILTSTNSGGAATTNTISTAAPGATPIAPASSTSGPTLVAAATAPKMVAASGTVVSTAGAPVASPGGLAVVRPGTAVLTSQGKVVAAPGTIVQGSPVIAPAPAQAAAAGSPRQIVAQQLPPGAQVPPGMTAFMQGGKTYCIPKAATQLAARQQAQQQQPQHIKASQAPGATMVQPQQQTQPQSQSQQQPQQPSATTQAVVAGAQGKQMVEVKTLGANTVTFKGQQMIVSGPDVAQAQAIANQLSTGQARLATLGGKQVLISTTTATAMTTTAATAAAATASPQQGATIASPILPTQPVPVSQVVGGQTVKTELSQQAQQLVSPVSSAQAIQPASSVPAPTTPGNAPAAAAPVTPTSPAPAQVTAQLLQTPQGPRIVLQGIQGSNLPKEDLTIIQQQVKNQLLKAQSEAKQQGKVPPTKIVIDLPASIQSKLQPQSPKTEPVKEEPQPEQVETSPATAVLTPDGQQKPKQMLVVAGQQKMTTTVQQPSPSSPASQQVLANAKQLLCNLTSTKAAAAVPQPVAVKSPSGAPKVVGIQKEEPINKVLANLSPLPQPPIPTPIAVAQPIAIQTATGVVKSPTKSPVSLLPLSSTGIGSPPGASPAKTRNRSGREAEKRRSQLAGKLQSMLFRQKELLKRDIGKKRGMQEKELQTAIEREVEGRVKLVQQQQMKHRVTSAASHTNSVSPSAAATNSVKEPLGQRQQLQQANHSLISPTAAGSKRKRQESSSFQAGAGTNSAATSNSHLAAVASNNVTPPSKKKKRDSSGSNKGHHGSSSSSSSSAAVAKGLVKKNQTYCVCKTKYDPTKFYVGCDICNGWFHGSCVGITEAMAKGMSDFVCGECQNAKDNREIYCLCKQPYDESQFYIGCEGCSDWFHGRCVGILQLEADTIDEYLCPKCDPRSKYNAPNMAELEDADLDLMRRLVKQIQANRHSWPFKLPVDKNEVPNYYAVVKEPMDLQKVEGRINDGHYVRLCEFVGDVARIFENCRLFNQPASQIAKCSEALENFFAQKLGLLREKIAANHPSPS